MKQTTLFFLLSLITFVGCEQEESIEPMEQKPTIEEVFLENNTHLQSLVNSINTSSHKNGRTSSLLDKVDFSKATKRYDSANQVTKYTFSMNEEHDFVLQNFILIEPEYGDISGLLFTHTIDHDWLSTFDHFPGWDKFTGTFTISDLEGNTISENQIVDGTSIQEGSTNGRSSSQTCVTRYILVTETYNTYVNGVYSSTTTHSWIETRTNCYSSGGGGGRGGPTLGDSGTEELQPQRAVLRPDDNLDPVGVSSSLSATELWEANNITLTEDFKNNPCAKGVYDQLMETNEVYKLLEGFMGESPTGKLKLDLNPNLFPNKGGRTINSPSGITVELNLNIFDSQSFLSVANFLLHEYVHAELFNAQNTNNLDFASLFNTFADSQVGTTQHNIMINRYVEMMGNVLSSIDDSQFDIDYYQALSYRGLTKTDFWINNIQGTADETIIESFQAQLLNGRQPCE